MAKTLRANSCRGEAGTSSFRFKLPKGITVESLKYILDLILKYHNTVPDELSAIDFYLGELTQVYPNLNIEICRHFVFLNTETDDVNITDESINNDSIVSNDKTEDLQNENFCEVCDLRCDDNNRICMRCKCLNLRVDQLCMDMKKVQHVIESLLNKTSDSCPDPAPKASTLNPPPESHSKQSHSAFPPLPEQPTPHGTAEQLADYRHKRKDDFMQQKTVVSERMKLQCDVLIVGDSILKPLRPSTMSSQKRVKCKTLPGAKIDDLFEPTKNMVDKNLPQTVIIHVGSNNMAMNDSTTIEKKVESLALQILGECSSVNAITISSIIKRRAYQSDLLNKLNDTNSRLKSMALSHGWDFINNDSIEPIQHLCNDGIHLSPEGVNVFAQNLIRHIIKSITER